MLGEEPAELPEALSNPKLLGKANGIAYRYYPSFSETFVNDFLSSLNLDGHQVVLDPWNGSGSTTRVSASLGVRAVGLDINPAMVVLAKARLLTRAELEQVKGMLCFITERESEESTDGIHDPLRAWFGPSTAALIRCLARRIVAQNPAGGPEWNWAETISRPQAHLLAALFLTVRRMVRPFIGTNPTWIRIPREDEARIESKRDEILDSFVECSGALAKEVLDAATPEGVTLRVASSQTYPAGLPTPSVILGSPPYCTRIDYAVATRPELSVMGIAEAEQQSLRRRMLGTTTVPDRLTMPAGALGATAITLLERVGRHSAKASSGYYRKWLGQYLAEYTASLVELSRVISDEGVIALVVQDSYYKNIHIDLAALTSDALASVGWSLMKSYDFTQRITMAGINPGTRKYRDKFDATEEALVFRRA